MSLRLWILLAGVLFLAGIYGWGKFQELRARRRERIEPEAGDFDAALRDEEEEWDAIPVLNERHTPARSRLADHELDEPFIASKDDDDMVIAPERQPSARSPARSPAPSRPVAPPPPPPKEVILTLSVLAPRNRLFAGADLANALEQAGMIYGAMNIFHAPADMERPDGPALFSLANVVEPGTLEPERLRFLETPGIVMFAQLPGPVRGTEVFEHMQATGRFLAQQLGGELCDDRRRLLTVQKTEEIRSHILSEIGDTVRKPDF